MHLTDQNSRKSSLLLH